VRCENKIRIIWKCYIEVTSREVKGKGARNDGESRDNFLDFGGRRCYKKQMMLRFWTIFKMSLHCPYFFFKLTHKDSNCIQNQRQCDILNSVSLNITSKLPTQTV
jgi:hypothetical protein